MNALYDWSNWLKIGEFYVCIINMVVSTSISWQVFYLDCKYKKFTSLYEIYNFTTLDLQPSK